MQTGAVVPLRRLGARERPHIGTGLIAGGIFCYMALRRARGGAVQGPLGAVFTADFPNRNPMPIPMLDAPTVASLDFTS